MNVRGRKIVVTGGAGFIGSHIVEDLVQQGARVTVYDNVSSGARDNLSTVADAIEFVQGDILDADALARAMRGADIVSHHAAQLEIMRCLEDPIADAQVNTIGALRVFQVAVARGVTRVIHASSACVYGQAQTVPQTEEHPTQPHWPYGVSKLAAEHYARIMHAYHTLPVTSLRYAIVYGPREWYGRVLTMFIRRALRRQPLVIFGDGRQRRDFIHVRDVVAAHRACLDQEATAGQTYNVGTGQSTTIAELAACVAKQAPAPVELQHEAVAEGALSTAMPERVRLPLELHAMVLNSDKLQRAVGWRPRISLAEGVAEAVAWARAHADRWRAVHI